MRADRINEKKTEEGISELECNAFNASVNCIIMLSDSRLCACSSDHSIKVFDILNVNTIIIHMTDNTIHQQTGSAPLKGCGNNLNEGVSSH